MARKPKAKKIYDRSKNKSFLGKLSNIRWEESYMSLILGLAVVIIAGIFVVSFIRNRGSENAPPKTDVSSQKTEKAEEVSKEDSKNTEKTAKDKSTSIEDTYTVVPGDTLWSIAEKVYQSGENWKDIADANKLENPQVVHPGNKLIIPKAKTETKGGESTASQKTEDNVTTSPNKITGTSYTIVRGDTLWDISVRAYGDGFKWVDLAKANNLTNPSLIHADNTLTIPR